MSAFGHQSDEKVLYVIRYTIQKMIEFPTVNGTDLFSSLFDKKFLRFPILANEWHYGR